MNSLNKVQLIGNTTAAPEVRETPNGQKVANFSIATNRSWKDAAGMKQEQTEFHNIVVWGRLAEIVEQYVGKGKKIYIEGRLQTRNWEDQAGQKRYKTEVVAENVILLGSPTGGGNMGSAEEGADSIPTDASPSEVAPARASRKAPKKEEEIKIEDIPF
jgi:single-strand DNA-binding protein